VRANLQNRRLAIASRQRRQIRFRHDDGKLDRCPGKALEAKPGPNFLRIGRSVVMVQDDVGHGRGPWSSYPSWLRRANIALTTAVRRSEKSSPLLAKTGLHPQNGIGPGSGDYYYRVHVVGLCGMRSGAPGARLVLAQVVCAAGGAKMKAQLAA